MKPMAKHFLLLLFILNYTIGTAQSKITPRINLFNFGVSRYYQHFTGNNFIGKTYQDGYPFSCDANVTLYKNFALGMRFKTGMHSLASTTYVGNSSEGKFSQFGASVSYWYQFHRKWAFVPRIAYSLVTLKNKIKSMDDKETFIYRTKGEEVSIAPELHYFLLPEISIFAQTQFDVMQFSNVNANEQIGVNYRRGRAVGAGLGLRLWINF